LKRARAISLAQGVSTRGGTGQGGQQGDELGEEQDQQQHLRVVGKKS